MSSILSSSTQLGSSYVPDNLITLLSRNISVGVLGCGYWGPKLARNFHELEGSDLSLICDLREDRLAEMRGLYEGVQTTRNFQQMLASDVDAVVIATPVHTHYKLVKAALLAGKHVLVEKPITSRSDHAEELVEIARNRGLTLMVGHTFVYNPAVEAVRDIVQAGELGTVFYMNATRANLGLLQPDINVMWDLGPHDISMLSYILGRDPITVSTHGGVFVNTRRQLHEVVYMLMVYESGLFVNLRLSWLDPVKQRRLTIVGSQKMLVYDDVADDKVVIFDKGVEVPPYSITEEEFIASYRHGGETVVPLTWVEPLRAECSHFVECIRTGEPPRSGGPEGHRVVRILEAAQRSLENGGVELRIEY